MSAEPQAPQPDPTLDALNGVQRQLAQVQAQLEALKARTLEQAAFARVLEQVDRYLTPDEAGVILKVDRRSIDRAVESGLLQSVPAPGTKSGWRVPLSSVMRLQKNALALAEMERKRKQRAALKGEVAS